VQISDGICHKSPHTTFHVTISRCKSTQNNGVARH